MVDAPAAAAAAAAPAQDVRALQDAAAQLEQARAALSAQRQLREANLQPARPAAGALSALDSSIKKNSAFTRRLAAKLGDPAAQQQLLDDIRKLNLSKYVSEVVKAVAEAPLRPADVPSVLAVCSELHQRYADFAPGLADSLARGFATKLPLEDERALLKRQRGALRLLTELVAAGIIADAGALAGIVRQLAAADFGRDREGAQAAMQLLASVGKSIGTLLLGGAPDVLASVPPELLQATPEAAADASPELQLALKQLHAAQEGLQEEQQLRFRLPEAEASALMRGLERGHAAAAAQLIEEHSALTGLERSGGRGMGDEAAEYEAKRKAFEALFRMVSLLAEVLGKPAPSFAEDSFTRLGAAEQAPAASSRTSDSGGPQPVFEDPVLRTFYEDLPDLRSLVPAVLLQDAVPAESSKEAAEGKATDAGDAPAEQPPVAAAGDGGHASTREVDEPSDGPSISLREAEAVLARLGSCVSKDLCDELVVNFCYVNSKAARRRLVRALVDVPRGQLQLLPYYARVAASMSQLYPDVGAGVVAAVEHDFDLLAAKKDPSPNAAALEARARVSRYLGELVKFRLAPPGPVLLRLKGLLDDFAGAQVDMACALVESAGRFLIRNPESQTRMEHLLTVMMRLKNARNMDVRHAAAVDNAFFATKPPSAGQRRRRRPPQQEYIRHLIFDVLDDSNIVTVLRKLMKLPWAEYEPYVLKCLMKVVRMRFTHTALIASLAGGLSQYHDSLGVSLVDCVLEEVRWGLEHPSAGTYQKRLAECRLLGDLYNYMLLDSRSIFDILHMIIGYGYDDPTKAARLDPADDFFRVRMVMALLSTCGQYFNKGAAKRRLDRFLVFLQAYYMGKGTRPPLDVDFDLQDMLGQLRPKTKRFESYEDATKAVGDILAAEAIAAANGVDLMSDDEESGGSDSEEDVPSSSVSAFEEDDDDTAYDRGEHDDEFEKEYALLMQEFQGPARSCVVNPSGGTGTVTLKLLMKRGGKDDKRDLQVPATTGLAASLMQREETEAAEKAAIKQLVLAANTRDEEEEMAAAAMQQVARQASRSGSRRGPRNTSGYYSRGGGRLGDPSTWGL